jgi:hypothetical protein
MSAHDDFLKFVMNLETLRQTQGITHDGLTRLLAGTEATTTTPQASQTCPSTFPTPSSHDASGAEVSASTAASTSPR